MNGFEKEAPRLLIVDDNRALVHMLSWHFFDLGYQVETAQDCYHALGIASQMHFDCALLDYHLPDGNGIQLETCLRKLHPELRTALMSSLPPDGLDTNKPMHRKPVSVQELDHWFGAEAQAPLSAARKPERTAPAV